MQSVKKPELLAPAGCEEAFYGAIHAGADAVYLGGDRFGARAYAENFTKEQLLRCIRYAHLWGRKVYLTVNTLVRESEIGEIYSYLLPLYEAGLDGVIVQDIGVFACIREHFPDLKLHVSTQMTVTGKYGASLLKSMGACRIVPARELSLKELILLKQETGLEIEVFIHGAMCYCYSGQCLFSSILGGRSGNRGRCAQPCRLPYSVEDSGEGLYLLSLKDMCTIEHIPDLIEAGIDSFKIEGRMKKPEYAAGVTAVYRKYIDAYCESRTKDRNGNRAVSKEFAVAKEDLEILSSLYIRSKRQNGYYYKQNGKDMVTLDSPAYSGTDENLLAKIRREYIEKWPAMPLEITGSFLTGQAAGVTVSMKNAADGILSESAVGETVQQAKKQPITRDNVEKQLKKLGGSSFIAEKLHVEVSPDAFYPLKEINELRRQAVALLEEKILERNGYGEGRQVVAYALKDDKTAVSQSEAVYNPTAVQLRTTEQLRAVLDSGMCFKRIYVDGDLLAGSNCETSSDILALCQKASEKSDIFVTLPYILRNGDACYLDALYQVVEAHAGIFNGFLVRSLEGLGFLREKSYGGLIRTDANMYIWNKAALLEFSRAGHIAGFCLPYELNGAQQRALCTKDCEKVIYGRLPMMITANCIAKTMNKCRKYEKEADERRKETKRMVLTDRYGAQFPVLLNCTHCNNVIYNSVVLSLRREMEKWEGKCVFRLDFTLEDEIQVRKVLDYFAGRSKDAPFSAYTTGHEKRGVL